MRIYRPIKTDKKSQGFGENLACQKTTAPFNTIKKTGVTCPFGYIDLYKKAGLRGHNGEDWKVWHGEPIYFPVEADTEWYAVNGGDPDGGLGVDIVSLSAIEGSYRKFRFWHLKQSAVKDDERIKFGQLIGYADSTGASSADHLHWSMKLCDDTGKTINNDNGYAGAVDFSPWYKNTCILDILNLQPPKQSLAELLAKLSFNLRNL